MEILIIILIWNTLRNILDCLTKPDKCSKYDLNTAGVFSADLGLFTFVQLTAASIKPPRVQSNMQTERPTEPKTVVNEWRKSCYSQIYDTVQIHKKSPHLLCFTTYLTPKNLGCSPGADVSVSIFKLSMWAMEITVAATYHGRPMKEQTANRTATQNRSRWYPAPFWSRQRWRMVTKCY